MRARKIAPGLILLDSPSLDQLGLTMMRLQEFYESQFLHIRGQYFELSEFIESYVAKKSTFSYLEDWVGYNIPGHKVDEFFKIFRNDLNHLERKLKELIDPLRFNEPRYYVIGAKQGDIEAIKHELAHAMYYLLDEYHHEVNEQINKLPKDKIQKMQEWLSKTGYAENDFIINDEINAYLSNATKAADLDEIFNHYEAKQIIKEARPLVELFNKYVEPVYKTLGIAA